MTRPRAADDFVTIRARMEELRRERMPAPPPDDPRAGRRPSRDPDTADPRSRGAERGRWDDRWNWSRSRSQS